MGIFNFLAEITTFGGIQNEIQIDWLGNIIKGLIEGCGNIGIGIIVFSLILKLITLPFDIISRVSTRKNAIKMEKMRPELEKLQRQYANNQQLYNLKLQKLYKENGYSAFSACLPTLLTLVIFIVVIGQFSTYSNYANFEVFRRMGASYTEAVKNYDADNNTDYIILDGDKVYFNTENFVKNGGDAFEFIQLVSGSGANAVYDIDDATDADHVSSLAQRIVDADMGYKAGENEKFLVDENGKYTVNLSTCVVLSEDGEILLDADGNPTYQTIDEAVKSLCNQYVEKLANNFIVANINQAGRVAAAEYYRSCDLNFLWVKNIWGRDLPWEHPIKASFSEYRFVKSSSCTATCNCSGNDNNIGDYSSMFNEITANLDKEKQEPNGYLILVILSIAIMLLSQIVMNKTQKTQTELSSVDGANGTSAQTQKMMMWMMPVMYGFFSFMYTASFSIYIIISSTVGLLSTLIINVLVEKKFAKLAEKEAHELELKRTGRISEIKTKDKKNKNNNKK